MTPLWGSAFPPLVASSHEISIFVITTLWFLLLYVVMFFRKDKILNNNSNGTIVIHVVHHGNITQTLLAWMFKFIAMIIPWGWISWRWDAYILLQKTRVSGELVSINPPQPRLCDPKSALWKKRMGMVAGRLYPGDPSLEGPIWVRSDALTIGGHPSSINFFRRGSKANCQQF